MKIPLLLNLALNLALATTWSVSFAQPTCTSNPLTISTSMDFSAITWVSSGGGICPPASTFTGNIRIDIANGVNLTVTSSITISGDFLITNAGVSTLTIPAGVTVHVNGNMGDANNNSMTYHVDGELIVDGTLIGKNTNTFEGSGSISGGTLDVGNGAGCGSPCPVTGGFDTCASGTGPSAQEFCESVLPIKLLYFNAHPLEESVLLKWATTMEEDFAKFVVQRSADGLVFDEIGELQGKGFNIYDIESRYTFVDEAPLLGLNYYRLKAIDLDDSFEFFGVRAVTLAGSRKLAIYPNPSSGDVISFRLNFNPEETDRVILTDHLGIEVFNSSVGTITNRISLKNKLQTGIYMLRYRSSGFEQIARVVIIN